MAYLEKLPGEILFSVKRTWQHSFVKVCKVLCKQTKVESFGPNQTQHISAQHLMPTVKHWLVLEPWDPGTLMTLSQT